MVHDWKTNLRLLSVQAAGLPVAADTALAGIQAYMAQHGHPIDIPAWIYLAVAVVGYGLVFIGRMIPQPAITGAQNEP